MSLYLEQRLETQATITPQQIIAMQLLEKSLAELEQTVVQETEQNPVLELVEHETCPRCGSVLRTRKCPQCLDRKPPAAKDSEREGWNPKDYGSPQRWDDDDNDPVSRVPGGPTLSEYLLWQIAPVLDGKYRPIAEYIAGSLDSHGFLTVTAEEVARHLRTDAETVACVIREIQKLDPPGICAANAQQALLIQLQRLREEGALHPLAEGIISHWDPFLKRRFHTLANILKVGEEDILQEYAFIEANLNPKPAHAYWSVGEAKPSPDTVYIRPDIAIRRRPAPDEGFEVEVLPGRSFTLRIAPEYKRLVDQLEAQATPSNEEALQQLREYMAKGKLFIRCVGQRWQTLQMIGDWLVDFQSDFLESGNRAMKPITRAELAERIGVHESTVSRAVANKYALLPNGQVIPLSDFFDDSLAVKDLLLHLIQNEDRPLSDQELAKRLADLGYPIARRTVAKYRQELGILPARLRAHRTRPGGQN